MTLTFIVTASYTPTKWEVRSTKYKAEPFSVEISSSFVLRPSSLEEASHEDGTPSRVADQ